MSENPPGATGLLSDVPDDKSFRLDDGRSIHSLAELYQTLQGLDETVFEHHVSKEKNDFGNWVKDIHKDYRLANSLFSAETREDCARAVGTRIYEIRKSTDKKRKNAMIPAPKPQTPPVVVKKAEPELVKQELPKPAPAPKPTTPSVQKPAAKSNSFSREEQIAKAILQQKPISPDLLSPRKKKKPVEQPKQVVPTDKKSMETASERLEKILAEAARTKMEEARQKKKEKESRRVEEFKVINPEPVIRPEPEPPKPAEPEEPSDNTLFEFPEPDDDTAEVIKLVESKSFAGQLKSDMKSVLSPSSLGSLAKDMKSLVPSKKAKDETVALEPEAKRPSSPGKSKDMIISHLKKVYK
jgi:hypothetical protein